MKFDPTLYLVTDSSLYEEDAFLSLIDGVCSAGITLLQLREKERSTREYLWLARAVRQITDRYGIPLILDDRADVAAACGCAGVHVGQDDMEAGDVRAILGADKIIGVSAHNVEEALRAERHGADYLGVGAAFTTSSKPEAGHIDAETIRAICETVKIPVIAIGGIKEENLLRLRGNGLCGVAVISAIFAQKDIEAATRRLHALAEEMAGDQE